MISNTYSSYNSAELGAPQIALLLAIVLAVTAGVVFMEQGARQVPIQYAKRQVGNRVYGGQTSHLPIRVNTAGVIPAIFASSLLQIPVTGAQLFEDGALANFVNTVFYSRRLGIQCSLFGADCVLCFLLYFDPVQAR